ncbi:MAG TPA: hypothetical protein DCG19_15025 [Cryomorphaceae bacterium]|nr:hypothetical protein [Cryomorphaceae bacterium]
MISIPLSGALEHRDSTGRHKIIRSGEVQIMSAGKGIVHSEINASQTEGVSFLQIWIIPDKQNIDPRYDQKEFPLHSHRNTFINVVAPDNPEALWINQQCWFYMAELSEGGVAGLDLSKPHDHGLFVFVIEGQIEVLDQILDKRDSLGLEDIGSSHVEFRAYTESKVLVIELPMKWH